MAESNLKKNIIARIKKSGMRNNISKLEYILADADSGILEKIYSELDERFMDLNGGEALDYNLLKFPDIERAEVIKRICSEIAWGANALWNTKDLIPEESREEEEEGRRKDAESFKEYFIRMKHSL